MNEIIEFKSTPENFIKEQTGLKPNTVRYFETETDPRFYSLMKKEAKIIRIKNTETGESFEREIRDATLWRLERYIECGYIKGDINHEIKHHLTDSFFIISWNHESKKEIEEQKQLLRKTIYQLHSAEDLISDTLSAMSRTG